MRNLYLVFILLMGVAVAANAQPVSQYYFKTKTGVALEDMTGALPLFSVGADGATTDPVPFFPFTFGGTAYDQFSVSEDGVIVLGSAAYFPYMYDNYVTQQPAFFGQSAAYPILLPWGEDLLTAGDGGIAYKITGTAPRRKLVIEFRVNSAEDASDTYNKTFQAWLAEGSNQITYVYGDIFADWYNNVNIAIAAAATDFLSVDGATGTASPDVVYDNSALYPARATVPVKGTAYVFSPTVITDEPPTPPAPALTASVYVLPDHTVLGQKKHTIYLGYSLQSVLLYARINGSGIAPDGYSYSWSPATGLSNPNVALPLASPKTTTTYTVTITDGKGGSATASVTINVVDVRCGSKGDKVQLCKTERGRSKELCISAKDVLEHLLKGETLGLCNEPATGAMATAAAGKTIVEAAATAEAKIYPVPSSGVFAVQLPATAEAVFINIVDAGGRQVLRKQVAAGQSLVQFDLTGKPKGVYLLTIASGEKVQTSRLVLQ